VLGFVGAVQAIAGAQFDRIINTFAGLTAGRDGLSKPDPAVRHACVQPPGGGPRVKQLMQRSRGAG